MTLAGCSKTATTTPVQELPEEEEEPKKPSGFRITLRVLLAYRDNVLDQVDTDDIKNRMREMRFASEVMERIDRVTKKHADDSAFQLNEPLPDPNEVANYLDNVMSPDEVKQYELICLQNDAPLAETADCHRILVAILGKSVVLVWLSRHRGRVIACHVNCF